MDAATAFGDGHALDAVNAALEFEPGEHPLPRDARDDFLIAAKIGSAGRDQLDPPALTFGIALIHAKEVPREQRRFVSTRASANFEHRRAFVGGIPRQKLERQLALGGWQLRLEIGQLLFGHRAQLPFRSLITQHMFDIANFMAKPPHFARRPRDRLNLGIILRKLHELVGCEIGTGHRRLKLVPARFDLGNALRCDASHASLAPSVSSIVDMDADS